MCMCVCARACTLVNALANGVIFVVQVGDKVQKGQVLCIVEAMKLMNEIEVSNTLV